MPELFPELDNATEAERLLREWALWWHDSDEAPAKMPGALHIRTSLYFTERKHGQSTDR